MDDKTLADKVVAIGIGFSELHAPATATFYYHRDCAMPMDAEEFVTKWPVAGALMETVDSCYIEKLIDGSWQAQASIDAMPTEWIQHKSASRAITEACVAALTENEDG